MKNHDCGGCREEEFLSRCLAVDHNGTGKSRGGGRDISSRSSEAGEITQSGSSGSQYWNSICMRSLPVGALEPRGNHGRRVRWGCNYFQSSCSFSFTASASSLTERNIEVSFHIPSHNFSSKKLNRFINPSIQPLLKHLQSPLSILFLAYHVQTSSCAPR